MTSHAARRRSAAPQSLLDVHTRLDVKNWVQAAIVAHDAGLVGDDG
jgi:hypothetical protein